MEKYFMLQDELKQLQLEGVNVEQALSLMEDIINDLVIDANHN